jgi:hypothetical protein
VNFESQTQDDEETKYLTLEQAIEENKVVPSSFPGADFVLTEIQVQFIFASNFLERLLTTNFYREYREQNLGDKIFGHEPLNKFYDLMRTKFLAWQALHMIKARQNPLELSSSE